MQKQDWLSLIRTLLVAYGSWLVGTNLFGTAVTAELWQEIIGAVLALGGAIWGLIDKTSGIEQFESTLRSLLVIGAAFITAKGLLSVDKANQIIGVIMALIPFIASYTAKRKNAAIISGALPEVKLTTPAKKAA